jgi:predicted amidohydrolase
MCCVLLLHCLTLGSFAAAAPGDNLVANPGFEAASSRDGVPDRWTAGAPSDALRPIFQQVASGLRSGQRAACIRSAGGYRLGYLFQDVPVEEGRTYEVVVRYRCEGIDNPNRCVLVDLVWGAEGWNDAFVSHWEKSGEWFEGRQRLPNRGGKSLRVHLLLRIDGPGAVFFDDVEVRQAKLMPPRTVKVASYSEIPKGDDSAALARALAPVIAKAAAEKCDIVCLTEGLNLVNSPLANAEPIPGPMYNVLTEAARQGKIYVIGCIYEKDGKYVYNTAFLLDRQGRLLGKYRKTHLHWPEMFQGVRPGDDHPVFDCDFGRIGIEICYDSWFPEVARVLALKGAEIIFCPNAGYHEACQAARTCDNGVYFVPASHNRVNVIWDPNFRELARGGRELLTANLELTEPKPYAYHQWQTSGMPQAYRQMPHTSSDRCLEELRELYRTVPSPK